MPITRRLLLHCALAVLPAVHPVPDSNHGVIALDENQDMTGAHPLSHLAQPLSIFQIHSLNAPSLQGSVIYIASSNCLLDEGEAGV